MAVFSSIIGAVSAIAGVVGTAVSVVGAIQQNKAAKKAEALRERQMNLEAQRERRTAIRQAQVAQATAISNASAQGGTGGSGIAGGLGQISNQMNQNITATNQNQEIGAGIFQANRQISSAQTLQSIGSGITGFGNAFASMFQPANRVSQNSFG